jgi:surface-anchored protein
MQLRNLFVRRLLVAVTAAVFGGFSPAQAAYENLWTAGHGDLDIHYDLANNSLGLGYHLDDNAVINGVPLGVSGEFEADYLTVVVPNAPFAQRIGGLAGLPGVFSNQTFWNIPQSNPGVNPVPFMGIGAEEIQPGIFLNNQIALSLKSVVMAPANGQFIAYRTGVGAPTTFIDTQNLGTTNLITVNAGAHGHYNLGFSQPGSYLLEFEAMGTLIGGGTSSGTAIYAFNVVPEPAAWVSMSMALVSIGAARRWRKFRSERS